MRNKRKRKFDFFTFALGLKKHQIINLTLYFRFLLLQSVNWSCWLVYQQNEVDLLYCYFSRSRKQIKFSFKFISSKPERQSKICFNIHALERALGSVLCPVNCINEIIRIFWLYLSIVQILYLHFRSFVDSSIRNKHIYCIFQTYTSSPHGQKHINFFYIYIFLS